MTNSKHDRWEQGPPAPKRQNPIVSAVALDLDATAAIPINSLLLQQKADAEAAGLAVEDVTLIRHSSDIVQTMAQQDITRTGTDLADAVEQVRRELAALGGDALSAYDAPPASAEVARPGRLDEMAFDPFEVTGLRLERGSAGGLRDSVVDDPLAASGIFVVDDDMLEIIEELGEERQRSTSSTMMVDLDDDGFAELINELDEYDDGVEIELDDLDILSVDEVPGGRSERKRAASPDQSHMDLQAREVQRQLKGQLDVLGGRLALRAPWGHLIADLRQEIIAEPDSYKRAAFLYLVVYILRLHGESGEVAAQHLESVSGKLLPRNRPMLLHQLAALWARDEHAFIDTLGALQREDERRKTSNAAERHGSIARARVLGTLTRQLPRASYEILLAQDVTSVASRATLALCAHRGGRHRQAASIWSDLLPALDPEDAQTISTLITLVGGGQASEVSQGVGMLAARWGDVTRAHASGDLEAQTHAQEQLIAAARREQSDPELMAASLVRFAGLLQRARGDDRAAALMLREAMRVSPGHLGAARQMEALAHRTDDAAMLVEACRAQLEAYQNPNLRALVQEQLALAFEADNASAEQIRAPLEHALHDAHDCLPALLTLGHLAEREQDRERQLKLREAISIGESPSFTASWRRAAALERAGRPAREYLPLYQEAFQQDSQNPHLFWAVERGLARMGRWQELDRLYEQAIRARGALVATLDACGFNLFVQRAALQSFFIDSESLSPEVCRAYWDELPPAEGREVDALRDETVFWRIMASDAQRGDTEPTLASVDRVLAQTEGESGFEELRARALLWKVYLLGWKLKRTRQTTEPFRQLFGLLRSPFMRRFVFHGLLRVGDEGWLAQQWRANRLFAGQMMEIFEVPRKHQGVFSRGFASELFARAGRVEEAADLIDEILTREKDLRERAQWRERGLALALRERRWDEVFVNLSGAERQTSEVLLVQLSACLHMPEQLEIHPDSSRDITRALTELEVALRRSDWRSIVALADEASHATWGTHDNTARELFEVLGMLTEEWGTRDLAQAARRASSAQHAAGAIMRDVALAARHRVAMADNQLIRARNLLDELEVRFGASASAFFKEEAYIARETPEALGNWYHQQIGGLSGELQLYARVMVGLYGWIFSARDGRSATMLDVVANACPDEIVLQFIQFTALRHASQHPSAERALRDMLRMGRSAGISAWASVRLLFHLAINANEPEDALHMLDHHPTWNERGSTTLRGLLERALRRPNASWMLTVGEGSGWALQLERAENNSDAEGLFMLARIRCPGACLMTELRAAYERRDWRKDYHIELRYASLRQAMMRGDQTALQEHFTAMLQNSEPALISSPWCPLRMAGYDLARLASTPASSEALSEFANQADPRGVGGALRLRVAAHLLQRGERNEARSLIPRAARNTLDGRAWRWLASALLEGDVERDARALDYLISTWRRVTVTQDEHRDLLAVQIGRLLTAQEQGEQALSVYEDALARALEQRRDIDLMLRVVTAQQLIARGAWARLARLWGRELERAEQPGERIGRAFRLAYLYERRLRNLDAQALHRAAALYDQVLEVQPNHLPSLHAALRIADWTGEAKRAARYLTALIDLCMDRRLKAAYHIELGTLYEHALSDPTRAMAQFQAALVLNAEDQAAFWGILRNDDARRDETLRVIEARLHTAEAHDRALFTDLALVLAPSHPTTVALVQRHQPENEAIVLVRVTQELEQGKVDEGAIRLLASRIREDALRRVFQGLVRQPITSIDFPIEDEGAWLFAAARAFRDQDSNTLEQLSRKLITSEGLTQLERAAEKTCCAVLLRWGGRRLPALEYCQEALVAHPGFFPMLRLSRLIAADIPNWKIAAEMAEREAHATRSRSAARRARLEASDMYRRYLSDMDAAIRVLREVLAEEPTHEKAYETLHEMYMSRGQIEEALKLNEQRIPLLGSHHERIEMLNRMADLALAHLSDTGPAVRYLSQSITLDPGQLRRLRVLAELYEQRGQFEHAALCYESAVQISGDLRLRNNLLAHLAQLYERRLQKFDRAEQAYQQLIEAPEHAAEAIGALLRLRERAGDTWGALELLDQLERRVSSHEEILKVRLARLHLHTSGDLPREGIYREARSVLSHHPLHQDTAALLRAQLIQDGREHELERIARDIVQRSFSEQVHPPYQGLYTLARGWGLGDLAYCLASAGVWSRQANFEMMAWRDTSGMLTRWPTVPVPPDLTRGVLPPELHVGFFEIVRRTQDAILESCSPIPYSQFIKRRNRISSPSNEVLELGWRWPKLFGLELRDVTLTERLPMGSALVWDGGLRLLVDRQWTSPRNPPMLLVRLGSQLAAWSMGIGYWSALERQAQVAIFERVIREIVPNWGHTDGLASAPPWLNSQKLDQWLRQHADERIAAYALELSGRLQPNQLAAQFQYLELGMERLAAVVMPDYAEILDYTIRLRDDRGPGKRQWTFLFTPEVARIREAIGIAYEGSTR